jgi:uncharacterized protein (DUF3820 family)
MALNGDEPDHLAQRGLCDAQNRLSIVGDFKRGSLRVVDLPEQDGVDFYRHGIPDKRLLRIKRRGLDALVDPGRDAIDGTIMNMPGPRMACSFPRRNTTARSHCFAISSDSRTSIAPTNSSAGMPMAVSHPDPRFIRKISSAAPNSSTDITEAGALVPEAFIS